MRAGPAPSAAKSLRSSSRLRPTGLARGHRRRQRSSQTWHPVDRLQPGLNAETPRKPDELGARLVGAYEDHGLGLRSLDGEQRHFHSDGVSFERRRRSRFLKGWNMKLGQITRIGAKRTSDKTFRAPVFLTKRDRCGLIK